jgi:hypothetical protein
MKKLLSLSFILLLFACAEKVNYVETYESDYVSTLDPDAVFGVPMQGGKSIDPFASQQDYQIIIDLKKAVLTISGSNESEYNILNAQEILEEYGKVWNAAILVIRMKVLDKRTNEICELTLLPSGDQVRQIYIEYPDIQYCFNIKEK